jgi:hypothetical protein
MGVVAEVTEDEAGQIVVWRDEETQEEASPLRLRHGENPEEVLTQCTFLSYTMVRGALICSGCRQGFQDGEAKLGWLVH